MNPETSVSIIGGGLAGCEAAWALASRGISVRISEMKPHTYSPAHQSPDLAELVCSNSLRAASLQSAVGLLKEELRFMGSLILEAADATAVPAGKALAVDRERFAVYITRRITDHPLIVVDRREVPTIPGPDEGPVIVATGPLTSDSLAESIAMLLGEQGLSFYDAIAPIVTADSLDTSRIFRASRYQDEGDTGDYLNAPMDESTYRRFVEELLAAEKVDPHLFEKIPHFEGCLPIEELARRGPDTLAFGPMKPVGLRDPSTGRQPFAVVQLRAENREGTLFNLVGFQTKMTYAAQKRVFRIIPGLESAEFVRLGSVHRNTYIDSPRLLDRYSRVRHSPHVFFAGQITGVEGYVESTASGLLVGALSGVLTMEKEPPLPSAATAIGALLKHTQNTDYKKFDPMNINYGLFDPLSKRAGKKQRKEMLARRALEDIVTWKNALDKAYQAPAS
jgi:methylenetetrahydrofolate--tRNA-(uracil-5-)-methyltransferase